MTKCRDCKFYPLEVVQDAAGRVRRHWAAPCRFDTDTLWAQMPVSVMGTAPKPHSMLPNDGEYCLAFKARDANKETSR